MQTLHFLLKKVIGQMLLPVGAVLCLWVLGVWLLRRRPGSRLGARVLILAGFVLLVASMPPVGWFLLHNLEQDAGPYADPEGLRKAGVKTVVVLGGGVRFGDMSPADQLGGGTLLRLMEGHRLWKSLGGTLVLSGGSFESGPVEADAMARMAEQLGVPRSSLMLERESWDTVGQAALLGKFLSDKPFALVTSASHMPRALASFPPRGAKPPSRAGRLSIPGSSCGPTTPSCPTRWGSDRPRPRCTNTWASAGCASAPGWESPEATRPVPSARRFRTPPGTRDNHRPAFGCLHPRHPPAIGPSVPSPSPRFSKKSGFL